MNKNQIIKICNTFNLGTLSGDAIPVRGGLIHRMWKITTSRGSFAIKELDATIMKRPKIQECYIQSEMISAIFKSKNIPAETALIHHETPLYEIDGATIMIFPWIEGKTLTINQVNVDTAKQIGRVAAKIHATPISMPALPTPEMHFIPKERWSQLAKDALHHQLAWAVDASKNLPHLIAWSDQYKKSKQSLSKNLVISHRDMDPKNVIWIDAISPVLIDWEGAGLINPTEEIINIALGWAGETDALFRESIFLSVIDGYRDNGGYLNTHEIPDALNAVVGGYLGWLEFNMCRSLGSSEYDLEAQQLGLVEIDMTFKKLHFLNSKIDYLIELISRQKGH